MITTYCEQAMFGLREKHIDRILESVRRVYEDADLRVMGWWCVLPLACGVDYGRTPHGAANAFEALDVSRTFLAHLQSEVLPENLALDLCRFLVEKIDDPVNQQTTDDNLSRGTQGKLSPEKRRRLVPFLTLTTVLSSIPEAEVEPITAARTWAGQSERKWIGLFFGTGVLFGAQNRALSDSVCDGYLAAFQPPRRTVILETLNFFGSRKSQ